MILFSRHSIRVVDIALPRVQALSMLSFSSVHFGLEAVAHFGWLLSIISMAFSFAPDNSQYYLIRKLITRRLDRTILWSIYLKVFFIFLILFFLPIGGFSLAWEFFSVFVVGATEFLYGAFSLRGYASNKLYLHFVRGFSLRVLGLSVCFFVFLQSGSLGLSIFDFYFISYLPLLFGLFVRFRLESRSLLALNWFMLVRFSLSNQLSAMTTNFLIQVPVILMPAFGIYSQREVGWVVVASRYIGFALQPVQVAQSFLVRNLTENNNYLIPRNYQVFFSFMGVATFVAMIFVYFIAVPKDRDIVYALVYAPLSLTFFFRVWLAQIISSGQSNHLTFYNLLGLSSSLLTAAFLWSVGSDFTIFSLAFGWTVVLYGWRRVSLFVRRQTR